MSKEFLTVNEGTIKSWLSDGPNYKVISGDKREGARLAVTNYKVLQVKDDNALCWKFGLKQAGKTRSGCISPVSAIQ